MTVALVLGTLLTGIALVYAGELFDIAVDITHCAGRVLQ